MNKSEYTENMKELILEKLKESLATDIKLIDISDLTIVADYFIIATGRSSTHQKAIADKVFDDLREAGFEPTDREGYKAAGWIVIDFGSVVVHIFDQQQREFYNLEHLWSDGVVTDITDD